MTSDMTGAAAGSGAAGGMGFKTFVALIAALMATNALAIDAMLPALGRIGASLGLHAANERQWVITSYILGFGVAQIVYGTLADRYGRKPVILWALAIYIAASAASALSYSFETLMLARFIQGLGAAGTRVLAVSIVRDCFEGRQMARIMSLSFLVFLAVPILAPSLGQLIMLIAPWQAIFWALAIYSAAIFVWIAYSLPETLHPRDRRPIELSTILSAARTTLTNRISVGYTLAQTLLIGSWLGFINSAQQIFADVFQRPTLFTLIFASIAGGIALASLLNARLVETVGMRRISHAALLAFIILSLTQAAIALSGHTSLASFAPLQMAMMFCFGLMMGNFGAMSMEPLGHIAGAASSLQGFVSILVAALIGFAIGQNFNATIAPLTIGFVICSLLALAVISWAERGKLFLAHQLAAA